MMRCHLILLASLLLGLSPAAEAMEILAPSSSCCIEGDEVIVIGKAKGAEEGVVEWGSNQRKSFRVRDGRFGFLLRLEPGEHTLTFRAGQDETQVNWAVGTRSNGPRFRYHYKVERGGCGECHQAMQAGAGGGMAAVCFRCHQSFLGREHLHEPASSDDCGECHAPHGSTEWGFMVTAREGLCLTCHDDPDPATHRGHSGQKSCLSCHDPHGGSDPLFLKESHARR